ncbi:MAG TPA: hemerythrin domain-containing protein [Acidimicrobiia bacterium]|nr:hemerythrin domain-containing protein [Acidimicrobiia bacterium]
MPDGFEMLEHEHRAVEDLFDRYEQTGDDAVAEQICTDLSIHGEIEEQVLYPELREIGERTSLMADEAEESHDLITNLVTRIRHTPSDGRLKLFEELWAMVDGHVRMEETEVFPELRDAGVDPEELGRSLEAARNEAIARSSGAAG